MNWFCGFLSWVTLKLLRRLLYRLLRGYVFQSAISNFSARHESGYSVRALIKTKSKFTQSDDSSSNTQCAKQTLQTISFI